MSTLVRAIASCGVAFAWALAWMLASPTTTEALAGDAVLGRTVLDGSAQDGSPMRLELLCHPDRHGGAITLHLFVAKALGRGDLDYEAFEGPDAPARDAARTRVDLRAGTADTSLERPAAGWFGGDEPGTFVFGVSELSGRPSPLAALLAKVGDKPGQLVWTQSGFADPGRKLVARFEFDAARSRVLRDSVRPCLP